MQTVQTDADAAATRKGNMIFWATIAVFLGMVGFFMMDGARQNSAPAAPAVSAPAGT